MKYKFIIILMACVLSSCTKDDMSYDMPTKRINAFTSTLIVGGNTSPQDSIISIKGRIPNPFTVTNMRLALNELINERDSILELYKTNPGNQQIQNAYSNLCPIEITENDIQTTHYHVKISVATEYAMDMLHNDAQYSTVEFYPYPLDSDISGEGIVDTNNKNDPIPVYACFNKDLSFPTYASCEILDSLYLPDENINEYSLKNTEGLSVKFINTLIDKAYEIVGEDNTDNDNGIDLSAKWYPSGTIMAWDDLIQDYVPLQGVKIRARKTIFHTEIAYTDETGYFRCSGSFRKPVNYSIIWESNKWDIRDGSIVQATYSGPKQKSEWNLKIASRHGKSLNFATIHRAVFYHFRQDIQGLDRVSCNRSLKITYRHKFGDENGHFKTSALRGLQPDIVIYGANDTEGWRKTDRIIGTTFHELGHAALFYGIGKSKYMTISPMLRESWASFHSWVLLDEEYKNRGYSNIVRNTENLCSDKYMSCFVFEVPNSINRQTWNNTDNKYYNYSPLFIDMFDSSNQRIYYELKGRNSTEQNTYPNDNVHISYDHIEDIKNIFYHNITLPTLKQAILKMKDTLNEPEQAINDLFELYI